MSDMHREIMGEIRLAWDSEDSFGSVQEWRFAICEVLAFDCGVWMPGFKTYAKEPEDTYAVEVLRAYEPDGIRADDWAREIWNDCDAYIQALTYILRVLDRYRDWCGTLVWDTEY